MKTMDVLNKFLRGKKLANSSVHNLKQALESLAKYSEEWPSDPVVINEWINQIEGYSDKTIQMWFDYVRTAGRYMQKISGRDKNGHIICLILPMMLNVLEWNIRRWYIGHLWKWQNV